MPDAPEDDVLSVRWLSKVASWRGYRLQLMMERRYMDMDGWIRVRLDEGLVSPGMG